MKKLFSYISTLGGLFFLIVLISGGAILIPVLLIFFPSSISPNPPNYQQQQQQGYLDTLDDAKGNIYTMCSDKQLKKTMCQQALDDCSRFKECYQMVVDYHNKYGTTQDITYQDYYNASFMYINQKRASMGLPTLPN